MTITPERLAEIRDLSVDSCSADAPHNPDVWALESARKDLLTEVDRLKAESPIRPDVWAVITPADGAKPRSLVFVQGARRVEVELSDDMATAFGLPARHPQEQAAEPLIDPDCRDGKCGSCIGGPCSHDCHAGGTR